MGTSNLTFSARAAGALHSENQVGKIKKSYGQVGELQIDWWGDVPPDKTEPLWVEIDSLAVPLFIHTWRTQGRAGAVVVFSDFEQEHQAGLLLGRKLYSESPVALAEDESEAPSEWIGYRVADLSSGREGVVRTFYDYPGNPLLGVVFDEAGAEEVLVPLSLLKPQKKHRLEGELPEGLFEL